MVARNINQPTKKTNKQKKATNQPKSNNNKKQVYEHNFGAVKGKALGYPQLISLGQKADRTVCSLLARCMPQRHAL